MLLQFNPGSVPVTPLSPLTFQAQRVLQADTVSQWVISGTTTSWFPTLSTSLEMFAGAVSDSAFIINNTEALLSKYTPPKKSVSP